MEEYFDEELGTLEYEFFCKEEKYVTWYYVSLIVLLSFSQLIEPFFETTIARSVELLSLIVMAYSFVRLKLQGSLIKFRGWRFGLCMILFLCMLQVFIRGHWSGLDIKELGIYIVNQTFSLPYIVAISMLFLPSGYHVDRICHIFFWGTLLVLPIWLIHSDELVQDLWKGETIGAYLPLLTCFLLAYPNNLSWRRKLLLWGIWGVYLVLMALNARRNMIFTLFSYAAIAYYINVGKYMRSAFARIILNALITSIIALPLLLNLPTFSNSNFKRLNSRITEDTRSAIELFFLADYYTYTPTEQAFGKGSYGTYYQHTWNMEEEKMGKERFVVETGYLNMMLKGGYILLAVMILVLLICLIKSFGTDGLEGIFFRLAFIYFIVACYATDLICTLTFQSVIFWLSVNLLLTHQYIHEEDELDEEDEAPLLI